MKEQTQPTYLFSRETAREHIKDLHDAATRFEDRAKRAEAQRDELLAALKECASWIYTNHTLEIFPSAKRAYDKSKAAIANAEGSVK